MMTTEQNIWEVVSRLIVTIFDMIKCMQREFWVCKHSWKQDFVNIEDEHEIWGKIMDDGLFE